MFLAHVLMLLAGAIAALCVWGWMASQPEKYTLVHRFAALLILGVALFGLDRFMVYKRAELDRAAQIPLDRRAELRVRKVEFSLDVPQLKGVVTMENTGHMRILPEAIAAYHLDILPERISKEQEDALFNERRSGNALFTSDNYTPVGEKVIFLLRPEVLGPNEWDELITGKKVVYLTIRIGYRDEIGNLYAESCGYYKAPDFRHKYACIGHDNVLEAR